MEAYNRGALFNDARSGAYAYGAKAYENTPREARALNTPNSNGVGTNREAMAARNFFDFLRGRPAYSYYKGYKRDVLKLAMTPFNPPPGPSKR